MIGTCSVTGLVLNEFIIDDTDTATLSIPKTRFGQE